MSISLSKSVCFFFLVVACGRGASPEGAPPRADAAGPAAKTGDAAALAATAPATTAPASAAAPPKTPVALQVLELDRAAIPAELPFPGAVVDGARFVDANGENFVILSQVLRPADNAIFLYATHYSRAAGAVKLMREVKDHEEGCLEWDNVTEFTTGALEITDLDADGVGEITFAYQVDCVTDMTPLRYKLLVLEGGEKYIIRGTMTYIEPDGPVGGEKRVDESFKKAPPELLRHAEDRWSKHSVRRF
jgi:hypothetical protein